MKRLHRISPHVMPRAGIGARFAAMLVAALLVVPLLALLSTGAKAASVTRSADKSLSALLVSIEFLDHVRLNSGFTVRLFRTTDAGECDPEREAATCPHGRLLIVSGLDLEGIYDPVLWQTSRQIGWELIGKAETREANDTDRFGRVDFLVKVCEAPHAVETGKVSGKKGGWWREVEYRIVVTDKATKLVPLSQREKGETCSLY